MGELKKKEVRVHDFAEIMEHIGMLTIPLEKKWLANPDQ